MKVFLSILFFILILSLIPIRFKIKFFLSNESISIKLYNFTIFKKSFKKDTVHKEEKVEMKKAKKINKKARDFAFIHDLSNRSKLKIISLIRKNKFKPCLYIEGFVNYSLNDASKTAISYGIIHTYAPLLTWFLGIVFKIKKFNLPITPIFKDCFMVKSEINCIFTLSIAKTIFIVILLINSLVIVKGDELARENI